MKPEKPSSIPPKSSEELEAEAACAAARKEFAEAAKKHDEAATSLKRTISDPKFRAVRLPTPSEVELPPEKR